MYYGITTLVSKYRLAVELWVVDRVQLHWAEYGVKNVSDWQVFRLGLLLKEVGTRITRPGILDCVTRLKMFVGKVAHLSRVYKTCHDTPCSGVWNYDRRVERNPVKVLTTREG